MPSIVNLLYKYYTLLLHIDFHFLPLHELEWKISVKILAPMVKKATYWGKKYEFNMLSDLKK